MLEANTQSKLHNSRTSIPGYHAQSRVGLASCRWIEQSSAIHAGPLRMVKGVIGLDSQLGINPLSEPKVFCSGNIPVVNPGSVECGSIPCSADFALAGSANTFGLK